MNFITTIVAVLFLGIVSADSKDNENKTEIPPSPDIYSLHITSNIRYRYAETLITSKVRNPANVPQEVTFYVVLPETAFITGFVMIINGTNYEAYVKEKEEAKREYTEAVASGLSAAHVAYSARDSNEFTVSVNVEPQNKVTFNLTYEQLLERALSNYKHEINLNPGQVVEDMKVKVIIEESLPIINLKVPDLKLSNEIKEIENDNKLAVIERPTPKKAIIQWTPTEEQQKEHSSKEKKTEGIKGQFIVHYDVDRSNNSQQILVDEGYFVHFFANDDLSPLNKHVVFVLDLSGSMHGRKLQQVKEAMDKILSDLSDNNYFSLVLFSDTAKAWAPNRTVIFSHFSIIEREEKPVTELTSEYIVPVNSENIRLAKDFISSLEDLGGTNIIAGLRVGVKLTKIGKEIFGDEKGRPEPIIIFLTDGEPNVEMSNPKEITKTVKELNSLRCAIFALGFGDGADMKFLRNLSLANSGFARNIYEGGDATLQLKNFFKEVASPLLSNITFKYLPGQVDDNTTKVHFDNFFSGSELVVTGKMINNSLIGSLVGRSPTGIDDISFTTPIIIDYIPESPIPKNRSYGHLERMWAYKSISQLLDKNLVEQNDSIKAKALGLALKYSFVTPLTSLVVVKPNETTDVDTKKSSLREPLRVGSASAQLMLPSAAYGSSLALAVPMYFQRPALPFESAGFAGPAAQPSYALGGGMMTSNQMMAPSTRPPPPRPTYMPPRLPVATVGFDMVDSPHYLLMNYTDIEWLQNVTVPLTNETFIQPPEELSTSDVIALNEPKVEAYECNVNTTQGKCTHLVHCVLDIFINDITSFLPWKCHIEPNFIGVCCPKHLFPLTE